MKTLIRLQCIILLITITKKEDTDWSYHSETPDRQSTLSNISVVKNLGNQRTSCVFLSVLQLCACLSTSWQSIKRRNGKGRSYSTVLWQSDVIANEVDTDLAVCLRQHQHCNRGKQNDRNYVTDICYHFRYFTSVSLSLTHTHTHIHTHARARARTHL
jgi:hypothetical protein